MDTIMLTFRSWKLYFSRWLFDLPPAKHAQIFLRQNYTRSSGIPSKIKFEVNSGPNLDSKGKTRFWDSLYWQLSGDRLSR